MSRKIPVVHYFPNPHRHALGRSQERLRTMAQLLLPARATHTIRETRSRYPCEGQVICVGKACRNTSAIVAANYSLSRWLSQCQKCLIAMDFFCPDGYDI